jgi:hypothetical protein
MKTTITRNTRGLLIILRDASGSMNDPMPKAGMSKAVFTADATNRVLAEISACCFRQETVRDYFDIAVMAYNHGLIERVATNYTDTITPISFLSMNPLRMEKRRVKEPDGAGGLVEHEVEFPVWAEVLADGGTAMVGAFTRVRELVSNYLAAHPACPSVTVLHLTDGESSDGDPTALATQLGAMSNEGRDVVVYNCHISSSAHTTPILFPETENGLPDEHAVRLFRMSSPLPEAAQNLAGAHGIPVLPNSRSFMYNADAAAIIQLFDIGTRVNTEALR